LSLFFKASSGSTLHHLLTQQILHLNIDVSYEPKSKASKILSSTFLLILSVCQRLINLNFCQLFHDRKTPIYISKFPSTSCTSSTLTKLKVNVATFDDFLYLLVGHLKSLSTLIVDVEKISLSFADVNKVNMISILVFPRETNC
jgi:hypothetical protein